MNSYEKQIKDHDIKLHGTKVKKSARGYVRTFYTLLLKEYPDDTEFTADDIIEEWGLGEEERNAINCALSDFVKTGELRRRGGERSGTYEPTRYSSMIPIGELGEDGIKTRMEIVKSLQELIPKLQHALDYFTKEL